MTHPDDQETEILLRRARLKPAPPELKAGILEAAKADSARRPRVIRVAAACAVVWMIMIGADAIVSSAQAKQIATLLDGREAFSDIDAGVDDRIILAEINSINGEASILSKRLAAMRVVYQDDPRGLFDAIEMRKGWTDYEN